MLLVSPHNACMLILAHANYIHTHTAQKIPTSPISTIIAPLFPTNPASLVKSKKSILMHMSLRRILYFPSSKADPSTVRTITSKYLEFPLYDMELSQLLLGASCPVEAQPSILHSRSRVVILALLRKRSCRLSRLPAVFQGVLATETARVAQAFVHSLVHVSAFASMGVCIGLGGTVPGVEQGGIGWEWVRWNGRGNGGECLDT